MDDLDDIKESEFITDTDDKDSLDEMIDSEQRVRNQQLWTSFQNAACCITKLYRDRAQPNSSPWVPFQNAASNLTTLYKDCIESQKRFAKLGYQVGRRRKLRELRKFIRKHNLQGISNIGQNDGDMNLAGRDSIQGASSDIHPNGRIQNAVTSILAVNQLNLDCDETHSHPTNLADQDIQQQYQSISEQQELQQHDLGQHYHNSSSNNNFVSHNNNINNNNHHHLRQPNSVAASLGNNEEDLVTFQQALVQPAAVRSIKFGNHNNRRSSVNRSFGTTESEEDRLLELNQFLSEEYYRHVGSRKRSCASIGGNIIKRARE